jgi:competence protein ComEA
MITGDDLMMKKLMLAIATMVATMGFAFAQVDVNKADVAALDSVKGVGPKMSKAILDERAKGEFKDWADFEKRVKGVGDKSSAKLSAAGLQVNGKSKEGAPISSKPADAKASKAPAPAAAGKPAAAPAAAGKPTAAAKPAEAKKPATM